jgi:protein SCO1/2
MRPVGILFGFFCLGLSVRAIAEDQHQGRAPLPIIQKAANFALTDQDGKPVRLSEVKERVLLVGFIFTTCSGTCPATTHRMAFIRQELEKRGLVKDVRLISITVDPVRDTPEVLRGYRRLYDIEGTDWSFLTGRPMEVNKVLAAWDMWAKPAANGQLDHPSRVFLVDARRNVREIYNLDFLRVPWVVEDIEMLLRE